MLDIEIIKWGCQFTDGFDWDTNGIAGLNASQHCFFNLNIFNEGKNKIKVNLLKGIYYPLFLQRVIEGINKGRTFGIEQNWLYIKIVEFGSYNQDVLFNLDHPVNGTFKQYPIIEAKEAAIKYIYENKEK